MFHRMFGGRFGEGFGRHHHCGGRGGGGHPLRGMFGGGPMGRGGFGRGGGGGGRRFGPGDLRLILLSMIEEKQRHGY